MLIRYRFIIKEKKLVGVRPVAETETKYHIDIRCILGILPIYISIIREG